MLDLNITCDQNVTKMAPSLTVGRNLECALKLVVKLKLNLIERGKKERIKERE